MPNFKYHVRDRSGKAIAGTIDAPTLQVAGDRLFQLGYLPIKIEEEGKTASFNPSDFWQRFQQVRSEEIVFFSQQLSTLYKAGVPLLTGLISLAQQSENKKMKIILETVSRQVEKGSTLFEAMAKYPEVFTPVYVNMIRAGETSGMLGQSLDRFVTLADRELRTRQRVKEATRYPKIVIISLTIAFGVLIAFVIPRFAEVFSRFNAPLPLPTRVMIGINNVFHTYWYIVLVVIFGIPFLIRHYRRTPKGKYLWDKFKIRMPVFGPLFLKIALSRFAYIFVMLNRSGIPILQTLTITSSTIDNVILSQSIEEIGKKVREGSSLTDAMSGSGRFTPLVIQMLSVGESSGALDEMLMRVTEYYDIEVENSIKKLSTYVEPTLTLFLGVMVLFLALAVFLPWWNLASLFR
jgi:type II secretory pathway component PulF